ncbi:MAG: radical SAM protein [Paraclostridium sp.]
MNLENKMDLAYRTKIENFGCEIEFSYPNQTMAVSITDTECSLGCAHCNGHYLKNMTPIDEYKSNIKNRNITSLLLSGGCSENGDVPIERHIGTIKELKEKGYRLNSHIGLMDKKNIDLVCEYLDYISFDLVFDKETINEVYKINKNKNDYIDTYEYIQKHSKVAPHICIGLKGGEVKGEYEIIDYLKNNPPEQLTFIVLIPTKNTEYENVNPSKIEDVLDVICEARINLPKTKINIGCMRPRGEYRAKLDELSIKCGVNNIVLPARSCKKLVNEIGLTIKENRECCIL